MLPNTLRSRQVVCVTLSCFQFMVPGSNPDSNEWFYFLQESTSWGWGPIQPVSGNSMELLRPSAGHSCWLASRRCCCATKVKQLLSQKKTHLAYYHRTFFSWHWLLGWYSCSFISKSAPQVTLHCTYFSCISRRPKCHFCRTEELCCQTWESKQGYSTSKVFN